MRDWEEMVQGSPMDSAITSLICAVHRWWRPLYGLPCLAPSAFAAASAASAATNGAEPSRATPRGPLWEAPRAWTRTVIVLAGPAR